MRIHLAALVSLSVAAGCGAGGDDGDHPDAGVSASCQEATLHDDLPWIETEVFARSCTFSDCHKDAAIAAQGLNLEPGMAYGELVNRPSGVAPSQTLVVPGDPHASYLLVALGQFPGTLPEGGTMPLSGPLLCAQKRDAIERWIAAGAQP